MNVRWVTAGVAVLLCLGTLVVLGLVLTADPVAVPHDRRSPVLIARSDPASSPPPATAVPDVVPMAPPLRPLSPHKAPPLAVEPPPTETQPPKETQPPAGVPAPENTQPQAPPVRKAAPVDHRYDGVLTTAEIGRLRRALKLSSDQAAYWPGIASILREVGRRQMAQVDAGQKPTFDLPDDLSSRLYSAVSPLLGTLREDQKTEIRRRAKMLGLESVASFI